MVRMCKTGHQQVSAQGDKKCCVSSFHLSILIVTVAGPSSFNP